METFGLDPKRFYVLNKQMMASFRVEEKKSGCYFIFYYIQKYLPQRVLLAK
jgi:hypothetical protein